MKQRFEELLPWYANGSLGEEDRAWVERYLDEHPESRAQLEWYRSFGQSLRESAPAVPETIGLARTLTMIRGDRPTWNERVSAFLAGFGLRPATAFAGLAVFAIQGGVILNLLHDAREDASEIRALRASTVTDGPMLKVNFAADAKEAQIRHLLVSVQGRLAGGPGQLGDYYIVVPRGQEEAIAARLKDNPIVAAISLAPGLPPRE